MSVQSVLRTVATEAFPGEGRMVGLAFAIGLYLGINAANTASEQKESVEETWDTFHGENTRITIGMLNDTVVFDVRVALSVAKNVFCFINKIRTEPIQLAYNPTSSLVDNLFNPECCLTRDEMNIYNNNKNAILVVYKTLADNIVDRG